MTIGMVVVRTATAVASTNGEGTYPSGDAWCSEIRVVMHPWLSPHSAISIAAR